MISLVSGAVGGNAAGAVMMDKSLGVLGISLAGIGGGGAIPQALGIGAPGAAGATDIGSIIGSIAGGGVGGGILMAIIGALKDIFMKKA